MKKFKQYLANELSNKEDDSITQILLTNHFDKALEKRWQQQLNEKYGLKVPQKTKAKIISFPRRIVAIAASVLFLISSYYLYSSFNRPTYQELANNHLSNKYELLSIKKELTKEDQRTVAANAYINGNYDKAIFHFEQITQSPTSGIEDYFYLGLSCLYTNQTDKAIPALQKALDLPHSDNIHSKKIINWYLGLAYIKDNQIEKAKEELEKIVGPKEPKARALLKLLKAEEL